MPIRRLLRVRLAAAAVSLAAFSIAACGGETSAPQYDLDGTWVGSSGSSLTVTLVLSQAGRDVGGVGEYAYGSTSGSLTLSSASAYFEPNIVLVMDAGTSPAPVRFEGTVASPTRMDGTLRLSDGQVRGGFTFAKQ